MSFIKSLFHSQFVRGSLLIFFSSNLANFGNFLYSLFMGRMLGPKLYGDLGAIFSLLIIISVPLGIFNLVVVKLVSSHIGKNRLQALGGLTAYLSRRLLIIGAVFCIFLVIIAPLLAGFIRLESYFPLYLFSLLFIFSIPASANRAVLQGSLFFSYLTINSIIEVTLKLASAFILVSLNFGLLGALTGPLFGGIAGYLLTVLELAILFPKKDDKKVKITVGKFLGPVLPVLFTTLTLNLLVNTDIILIRHFFPADLSGQYVALTTVGKIIFYAVGPVISVMFPLVNGRVASGQSYILPLLGTLVFSLLVGLLLIVFYFLFPEIIINTLFGNKYLIIGQYLGLYGFFMIIYTIDFILTYFLLSLSYNRSVYALFPISFLQMFLIFFFHGSIYQVIWTNIFTGIIYLFFAGYFIMKKESRTFINMLPKKLYKEGYGR